MTHRTLQIVPRLLLAVACGLSPSASAQDDVAALKQRIAALEAQLAERDLQISALEARLAELHADQTRIAARQQHLDRRERQLEALAGAVATGELTERYAATVSVDYDAQADRTTVTAGPVRFEGEQLEGDFFFSAVYGVPGDGSAGTPDTVSLFLQTRFSGGLFEKTPAFTFDVAGEALTLPVADYQQARKRSGIPGKNTRNKSDEAVTFLVDVPMLRRLAEATTLSVRTPQTPLTFSREQRALLRALLLRMEPGAGASSAE